MQTCRRFANLSSLSTVDILSYTRKPGMVTVCPLSLPNLLCFVWKLTESIPSLTLTCHATHENSATTLTVYALVLRCLRQNP